MVKKLLVLLAILLLPALALADGQVIDNAGLFTPDDVLTMEAIIGRIENDHQVDMVVLTTYDVPDDYSESMWRIRDYADDFYDNGGYGMGPDYSGMLILLDMNNRAIWLSTGGVMIEYINDMREEAILDRAYDHLSYGGYASGVQAALERVEYYLNKGRAEGTFLYDEATGQRLSGMYNALTTNEIMLAGCAAAAAALVVYLCVHGSYNLTGSTYSYDVSSNASVRLTRDDERFVRPFVTRAPRNTTTHSSGSGRSGGSGVHRSSGGRSHGGGGRRF